jgi:hypothetical protein
MESGMLKKIRKRVRKVVCSFLEIATWLEHYPVPGNSQTIHVFSLPSEKRRRHT